MGSFPEQRGHGPRSPLGFSWAGPFTQTSPSSLLRFFPPGKQPGAPSLQVLALILSPQSFVPEPHSIRLHPHPPLAPPLPQAPCPTGGMEKGGSGHKPESQEREFLASSCHQRVHDFR